MATESRKEAQLSPDRPETDPSRDELGYAPFAEQLARAITAGIPEDGFVTRKPPRVESDDDWGIL